MTCYGGAYHEGCVFSIDLNNKNQYTDEVDFKGANGANPYGSLVLNGSTLYGMTSRGGTNNYGVVFSFIPNFYSSIASTNISCFGLSNGSASVSLTGGTSPFTYKWSNSYSASNLPGLSQGNYTLTVTDVNGCNATASTSISQPKALTLTSVIKNVNCFNENAGSISGTNVSCFGGSNGIATVLSSGGTLPYTYLWGNNNSQTGAAITGLSAGSYTITIIDSHGCTYAINKKITQPTAVRDSISSNTCSNSKATVTIGIKNGTSPYFYSWSPGGYTRASVSGLSNGSYTVTVTDNNKCMSTMMK